MISTVQRNKTVIAWRLRPIDHFDEGRCMFLKQYRIVAGTEYSMRIKLHKFVLKMN